MDDTGPNDTSASQCTMHEQTTQQSQGQAWKNIICNMQVIQDIITLETEQMV